MYTHLGVTLSTGAIDRFEENYSLFQYFEDIDRLEVMALMCSKTCPKQSLFWTDFYLVISVIFSICLVILNLKYS